MNNSHHPSSSCLIPSPFVSAIAVTVGLIAAGCGAGDVRSGPLRPQGCLVTLAAQGPTSRILEPGQNDVLAVALADECTGAQAGVNVSFRFVGDELGALLAAARVETDELGLAAVGLTAGPTPGSVVVDASADATAGEARFTIAIVDTGCLGHCSDGLLNCGETGLDCGGECGACVDPCANHCGNGVTDCGETGLDCGGTCVACGDPCAGHCGNGLTDCGETGLDCGGSCVACGDPCAGHCTNGLVDCGESGIDCGGGCAACTMVDAAALVGHTLPATLTCAASASATVTFQNNGTSTWHRAGDDGYKLGYVDDYANPFLPASRAPRVYLEVGQTVAPGARATFTVPLAAPVTPGTYTAQFQMILEGEHWFGDIASRTITVTAGCGSPSGCTFPQGVPEEDFIASASSLSDTDPAVDAAVNAVMAELTGCSIGSSCDIVGYPGANAALQCQSWFAAVNAKLREQGLCAGLHEEGFTDEIAVSNTGCAGKWYGYHVCYYGGPRVVWNPGARRGWWQIAPAHCQ